MQKPVDVLFITGAFVGNNCWDKWKTHFESKGYKTSAPPWPGKDASPQALRSRQPDPVIAANRLAALTDYYSNLAEEFSSPPILIGHSIGGLLVQLLLQRGLGSAGVAIHSVPPQGIMTFKFSFLKAGWGPLGFFTNANKSFLMSFKQWQYAFTNGMDTAAQQEAYYEFAIPESKRIVRDTITSAAKVDFNQPHAPLLFLSGSADHTIPASLNYDNYKKYKDKNSITAYRENKGRNHFVLGQSTWKEDADYILDWLAAQTLG
ncbi:MAG: alpha/beta fold hydrolase [Chitinophagaceae bacterium]